MTAVDLGVAGVTVGHWTDAIALTGCTVVRFPPGTVASGEVRGGAPATRELDLLVPGRLVGHLRAGPSPAGSVGDGAHQAWAWSPAEVPSALKSSEIEFMQ